MRQIEVFELQLKQLQEIFLELQEAVNPVDKLARSAEIKLYLRLLSMLAERLHDEIYRHSPHKALRRIITSYRQINPPES